MRDCEWVSRALARASWFEQQELVVRPGSEQHVRGSAAQPTYTHRHHHHQQSLFHHAPHYHLQFSFICTVTATDIPDMKFLFVGKIESPVLLGRIAVLRT